MKQRGFTLIELLIVIGLISFIFAAAAPNFSRYSSLLNLNASAKLIASDLRLTQNKALTQKETLCYDPVKVKLPFGIKLTKTKPVYFSGSGNPAFGSSGTIIVENKLGRSKKIILSSAGRIRIE
ncbi:MAG: prepilin-type N-terminal cleavage/methylation domain-containing protein [Candidatus Margulisbacteria bacterium]|nr:prepilin-type N-terminal cleavage/methylation domain-containing protein [Candidatus Margulisiibacteriota bacterium]